MARTIVDTTPWSGQRALDLDQVVALLVEVVVEDQANEDKAGDPEDACWYEGRVSAASEALDAIFGVCRDADGDPVEKPGDGG